MESTVRTVYLRLYVVASLILCDTGRKRYKVTWQFPSHPMMHQTIWEWGSDLSDTWMELCGNPGSESNSQAPFSPELNLLSSVLTPASEPVSSFATWDTILILHPSLRTQARQKAEEELCNWKALCTHGSLTSSDSDFLLKDRKPLSFGRGK